MPTTTTYRVHPTPHSMTLLATLNGIADRRADDLAHVGEMYAETLAQHQSETALYGDSWPGAAQQIDALRLAVADADRRLAEVLASIDRRFPVLGPVRPAPVDCADCGRPLADGECSWCEPF